MDGNMILCSCTLQVCNVSKWINKSILLVIPSSYNLLKIIIHWRYKDVLCWSKFPAVINVCTWQSGFCNVFLIVCVSIIPGHLRNDSNKHSDKIRPCMGPVSPEWYNMWAECHEILWIFLFRTPRPNNTVLLSLGIHWNTHSTPRPPMIVSTFQANQNV